MQSIYIIRHGDRWDYSHPGWREDATRVGDPPLSSLGHRQAREVGAFLDALLASDGIVADRIELLSSPFLRTVQTSNDILSEFRKTPGDVAETVAIKPEYSVFEIDGHDGKAHACLPSLEERKCYFPRLDEGHASLFVPAVPENNRGQFFARCERVAAGINARYPHIANSAIIIVTHAACCVSLAAALSKKTLADMNPAPPCGIYRLTRTKDCNEWKIDSHAKKDGFNGRLVISDMGTNTVPWNHFGDKNDGTMGYTGPPRE